MWKIVSSSSRDSFNSSFLIWTLFISSSCWIAWPEPPWECWTEVAREEFSLACSFSPWILILLVSFSQDALYQIKEIPSIPRYCVFLSWKVTEFYQMLFLHLLRWSYGFCSFFCWYGVSHWLIGVCWTIPVTLGWIQLDCSLWSFSQVFGFGLLIFCWEFLHLYSYNDSIFIWFKTRQI